MPSIASNKAFIREELDFGPDHDAILADLEHEIDKHNRKRRDTDHSRDGSKRRRHDSNASDKHEKMPSKLRFRFKDNVEDPRRKRRHRRHRSCNVDNKADLNEEQAHPFPREPVAEIPQQSAKNDAFLTSLLDALQDDEAAAYWESVYNQPIHTFSRPEVQTARGELEQMSDEQYASWVKQKMWEKQHPEFFVEQERLRKQANTQAEAERRRKDEYIRRRQKEAWNKASRHKEEQDYEYVFDTEEMVDPVSRERKTGPESSQWDDAWRSYLAGWERLKADFSDDEATNPSKILPWPTLPSQPPIRANIQAFLHNMPHSDSKTRRAVLKAERVRWHPDKIQQRFQNRVDDGTMKVVTGIFQIIDDEYTRSI